MTHKLVKFSVSEELIRQALAIPDNASILDIVRDRNTPYIFTFIVEGPEFPETPECSEPTEITPIVHADISKRPDTWLTFDWNLPPT